MQEKSGCKHKKVYASYTLLTDPPARKWICRICGAEGIVYVGDPSRQEEYEELVKQFRTDTDA